MKDNVRLKLAFLALLVHWVSCTKGRIVFRNNLGRRQQGRPKMDMSGNAEDMSIFDSVHGVKMGISNRKCDDGVNGIEIDWDTRSKQEIMCYSDDVIQDNLPPLNITEQSDKAPMHVCLFSPIVYPTDLPLSGSHRPLWPKYGEYLYLPPQRWVHSLEHGAVALLYHPCRSDAPQLDALKSLVRDCLGKHVITPYRKIPFHMPYALLTYKHALLIGSFDPTVEQEVNNIVQFIKDTALEAPESKVFEDGQYSAGLVESATEYSDLRATKETLCAFLK